MRKIEINFNDTYSCSSHFSIFEDEERILIEVHKHPTTKPLFYSLSDCRGHKKDFKSTDDEYIRFSKNYYDMLEIRTDFKAKEWIKTIMYVGSYAEILIMDISLNLNKLYQKFADPTKIMFEIGLNDKAKLIVEEDDSGNYNLMTSLTSQPTHKVYHDVVMADTATSLKIKTIYNEVLINHNKTILKKNQILLSRSTIDLLKHY